MCQSLSVAQAHAIVGLKELVGEMLCEEGEHEVGALGVGSERPSLQQPLNQQLRVRQSSRAWKGAPQRHARHIAQIHHTSSHNSETACLRKQC